MAPVSLGPDGPMVSPIALGVMKWGSWGRSLSADQIRYLVETGLECGMSTLDHADIYGDYTTEAAVGAALGRNSSLRQRLQLVTKCGIRLRSPNRPEHQIKSYDTSAEHIRQSVELSLRHLHTDYIDILLIHRPDPLMDPDALADIFAQLKREGKVLHVGVSNFSPSQFELLHSRHPLVTNQVEASAMTLDPFVDGTFDQCLRYRLRPMAWAPLGGGRFFTEPDDLKVKRIRAAFAELAPAYGHIGAEELMLAFLLRHPAGIVPVIGTANPDRIRRAAQALDVELSRSDWFRIWTAATGHEVA
jgi:predicted oxidoreductase